MPAERIRSLVESENLFFKNTFRFLYRYFSGRIYIKDIESEIRAQIEKALGSGLTLSHIDSHRHLHLLPRIQDCILSLTKEYKIPYIRCGNSRCLSMFSSGMLKCLSFNILSRSFRMKLRNNRIASCDETIGLEYSGHLTETRLLGLLSVLHDGFTELVCHPGRGEIALENQYKGWGYNFENELKALLNIKIRELIKEKGVILTNFTNLSNALINGS